MADINAWNQILMEGFRADGGKVGGTSRACPF
jgi:hypothetical protein